MKKQKVFIVGVFNPGLGNQNLTGANELNSLLETGWVVKDVHQLTASHGATSNNFVCLVVAQEG